MVVYRRWLLVCVLCFAPALVLAQRGRQTGPPPAPPEPDQEQENGEPEYTFNPIQAQKELKIGDFYFKKKSYRAAAGRYERATKWQPDLAEAYYKLGESREKLEQNEQALAAYRKYLDLSPPPKQAEEARKKIAQLLKQRSATASK